ncbi:MAG: AAA family ATPase [Faecousia sp.]
MAKPRIIIADNDSNYIIPLQLKFVEDFFEKVDLEIITDKDFFENAFSISQCADILVISEDMYDRSMQRHNIAHIFLMTEQYEEESTADLRVNRIFKYTSIREIFNKIIGKSGDVLKLERDIKQATQVVLFYSASGGTGKTTAAMGVSASLTKNYKKVLYINASRLQSFQHMLENSAPITAADVYAKLSGDNMENAYVDVKHVIRRELFNYLPPFKAALMSLGLRYSVFGEIIKSARKSGDFDFIIVDVDVAFDEDKADLINLADKVVIITNQSIAAVYATNTLVANINGLNTDKYIFICNDFDKLQSNALISPQISLKFTVSDYIDHFRFYEQMKLDDLSKESSIQRVAFLII